MRIPTVAALSLAVLTSACQTPAQETAAVDDPTVWGRFDCQRTSSSPELAADFERAKLVCIGRADAAAIAGTAGIRPGYSTASAIVAGIESGQKRDQISMATGTSCMAEYGYRMSKRSELEALCPAPPAKSKSPTSKKTVS
jgi:hypothetical protein